MPEQRLIYVGTYTKRGSEGIYVYRFNPDTAALEMTSKATGLDNPSFLAVHPTRRYLCAVNEARGKGPSEGGAVSAFSIAPKTGELTFLNRQSAHGASTCHLSVEQTGRFVLAANYSSGSVAMLPIGSDGRLGEATALVQHEGSSIDPKRQTGPHAHSILPDPSNRYAFAPDLGLDKIMIYRLDLKQGRLLPNDPPWAQVHPGAGPRHFAFHPNRRYAYVINELGNTMVAFRYDETCGALQELQTISTLPADFTGTSYCADVHVHPNGKFLYGSNRGHNSIAIFTIDESSGRLALVGCEPTQGDHPRNFMIDPTGTFLLVANQNTDNIVSFRIDGATGGLKPTGLVTNVSMPVCLKMISLSS
ncbi:MAG: lactonase family protein [Planctomycetota bacterium]